MAPNFQEYFSLIIFLAPDCRFERPGAKIHQHFIFLIVLLMDAVVNHFSQLQQSFDAARNQRLQNLQANQQQAHPPIPPPIPVTAEDLIENRKDNEMKLFTNFTVNEFVQLYDVVKDVMSKRTHKDAKVSPQTRFLITLCYCKFNQTIGPMANRFGLHYTYTRQIFIDTIKIAGPVLQENFIRWISVSERLSAQVRDPNFPLLIGSVDATVQKILKPKDQKPYYSGKHKFHCMKTQALVNPQGYLISCSDSVPGAKHDFQLFQDSRLSYALNQENNRVTTAMGANAELLADSGYQGITHFVPFAKTPYKKPRNGTLTEEQKEFNRTISRSRIIVENWFGRLKTLWMICGGTYRNYLGMYSRTWKFCAALTNFHISLHPLRADDSDGWRYYEDIDEEELYD